VILRKWFTAAAVSASLVLSATGLASAAERKQSEFTFGVLRIASTEAAKSQCEAWLKTTGKMDQNAFDAVWASSDPVLDKVAGSLKMGNSEAAAVLSASANADRDPPKQVPDLIKDAKKNDNDFFRANLALVFARDLVAGRVYEEALTALDLVQPEQVVDPSAYFFYKAVAEHALIKKDKAVKSIFRLIDDVPDAPDRYLMVGRIMLVDMLSWKKDEKDLDNIAKLMDNSERRLDLSRPGKVTQDIQKKIVFRLDELIKELEAKAGGSCNGCGAGAGSGNGGGIRPSSGRQDSGIAGGTGPGAIQERQIKHYQDNWGKMPEHERARAIQEMTRDLPPRYKLVIEDYFKSLNKTLQQ
jgi:hypothetical protein